MNPLAALYGWWLGIPAPIREPIKSAAVSLQFTLQTEFWMLFGAAGADGHLSSFQDFAGYCVTHAWGAFIALLYPTYYRAQQGFKAATQAVSTSASFSVPQPPPPAHVVGVVIDPNEKAPASPPAPHEP